MRRKRQRGLGDLTAEEYVVLKRETDARIARDYAPGNVIEAAPRTSGPASPKQLGVCYLDLFVDHSTGRQLVTQWAVLQDGSEIALGYNTFETVRWTGETSSIDGWITKNVSERRKRKKHN